MSAVDCFGNSVIDSFSGEYRFLSNFWPAPIEIWGKSFPTTEHAYQTSKTVDELEKNYILWKNGKPTTPGLAKRRGNEIVNKRPDWVAVRDAIMLELQMAKFTQHPDLLALLKATGTTQLIEGNTWCDNHWGTCTCPKCGNKGRNALGLLLMHVRTIL